MNRSWWYRFVFLLVVLIVSIVAVIPTVFDHHEDTRFPIKSKISLGLDLQGGLYMILGVDFNKAYKDEVVGLMRKLETRLKDDGVAAEIGDLILQNEDDPKHTLVISNLDHLGKAKQIIKDYTRNVMRMTEESDEKKGILAYGLLQSWKTYIQENAISKSIEVIRNRIDEFGVTEPEIVSQGSNRIVVQLPGVKDIDRAKDLIGRTAKLEFRIVNDQVPMATVVGWLEKAQKEKIIYQKGTRFSDYLSQLNAFLKDDLPKGYELAFQKNTDQYQKKDKADLVPYLVETIPRLGGDDLQDARVQVDQEKNQPYVSLEFKSAGARLFEQVTGDNIGKRMAVILDGNVYTAPTIQARIPGGHAQITLGSGGYNKIMKEARDIALVLRAGALPVQLDFEEQRIIGPSLGHDSIIKARMASVLGAILLFIFIVIYYKISGVIAIGTLVFNMIFILAALVGFEATLTLPGIAGIALTLGMAVDANIIIYERIREEIRKGVGFYKAVEEGFNSAFWTIIDANITTALAGLCLFNFGTGPIRGFAVTLLIGIASTVYTAYFVSKIFFEFYMNKVEGQDLSI